MADPDLQLGRPPRGIRSMSTFVLGAVVTAIGALALITELVDLSLLVAGPPVALTAAIVIFIAVAAAPRR